MKAIKDAATINARVAELIEVGGIEGWNRSKKSAYPVQFNGTHKYEVKAVSVPYIGSGEKRVRTYYVASIAELMDSFNQYYDFFRKLSHEHYETIVNNCWTAHYVTRIY